VVGGLASRAGPCVRMNWDDDADWAFLYTIRF